nr:MAG TPA: baseplate protein [Caudoviricetes sp.]
MLEKEDVKHIELENKKKQLAIIKASNELLYESKEKAMEFLKGRKSESAKISFDIDKAIKENEERARTLYNVSEEELYGTEYGEVSDEWKKKYNERLKYRNLNDEELHKKDIAVVGEKENNDGIKRRKRRTSSDKTKNVEIKNEDLMLATKVVDDKQIELRKEENDKLLQKMLVNKNSKEEKDKKVKEELLGEKSITTEISRSEEKVEVKEKKENTDSKKVKYSFDLSSVPDYVQYDVIPLPSNGECYPEDSLLRCGKIPVSYLTASDENIIASPNIYRDGKLLDVILSRKILDKNIDYRELCVGDRDAIILWLRATSYGVEFPITATHPMTGKQYNVILNLSDFKYNKFKLKSDENGHFSYTTKNGKEIKFKYFTYDEEELLKKKVTEEIINTHKFEILNNLTKIVDASKSLDISKENMGLITEDIEEIKTIIGDDVPDNFEYSYPNVVTEQMILHTYSIDGNTDREFIKNYIENMRTIDAKSYRDYFLENKPGVDFNFTVDVPESDGGGSFTTFLKFDDTVFLNF